MAPRTARKNTRLSKAATVVNQDDQPKSFKKMLLDKYHQDEAIKKQMEAKMVLDIKVCAQREVLQAGVENKYAERVKPKAGSQPANTTAANRRGKVVARTTHVASTADKAVVMNDAAERAQPSFNLPDAVIGETPVPKAEAVEPTNNIVDEHVERSLHSAELADAHDDGETMSPKRKHDDDEGSTMMDSASRVKRERIGESSCTAMQGKEGKEESKPNTQTAICTTGESEPQTHVVQCLLEDEAGARFINDVDLAQFKDFGELWNRIVTLMDQESSSENVARAKLVYQDLDGHWTMVTHDAPWNTFVHTVQRLLVSSR